ncbi:hypothetical protein Hanom_Chr06g00576521 [Helianthus anomalus]
MNIVLGEVGTDVCLMIMLLSGPKYSSPYFLYIATCPSIITSYTSYLNKTSYLIISL